MELSAEKPNRKYETVIIMHPDASEKDQKDLFSKNKKTIESFKGEFGNVDLWGKRRLASPIGKLKMGTYFHAMFEANPQCVSELERTMRINDKVLRFHHQRMDDRTSLSKHLEAYRDVLAASSKREQEREAKNQARKAARRQGPPQERS